MWIWVWTKLAGLAPWPWATSRRGETELVDLSDFIEPGDDQPEENEETEDLVALKDCLQALADAIASTNLAVINGGQGDVPAATKRVQASIAALKRFHDAFGILKGEPDPADEET